MVFLATSWSKNPVSIYDQVFSQRIGDMLASNYVSVGQYVCSSGLAVIVLVVGVVLLVRATRSEG
jgi:tRNA G37 N-methylase TrmD